MVLLLSESRGRTDGFCIQSPGQGFKGMCSIFSAAPLNSAHLHGAIQPARHRRSRSWLHTGWSPCCTGSCELTSQSNISGLVQHQAQANVPTSWLKNNSLFNTSLKISPLLCPNTSQCHFFFCKKRETPDLLSNIALRPRKELGGYHFAQKKLSVDAEEEDREVVNMYSACKAPQVDVSPSVTSTKAHAAWRMGCT